MTHPGNVVLEIAPDGVPLTAPAPGDWDALPTVNGKRRVKSLTWDIGRSHELDNFPPSHLTAVARNHDRYLDPDYTSGPLFGKLLPRVPMRLRLDVGSGLQDEFYGFVESGFRQTYQKPVASQVDLELVDLLGVLESIELPRTAYDHEVLADNPVAYWKLDEDGGYQMADSSGNGNHGHRDNGEPLDALVFDGGHGFSAAHEGDDRGRFVGGTLPVGAPCTIEAWVKLPRNLTQTHIITNVIRDSTAQTGVTFKVDTSAAGSPNGELVIHFVSLGGSYKARGSTRIDDDAPHHVAVTINGTAQSDVKLYVDGVLETKTTISGTTAGAWPGYYWWTVANTWDLKRGSYGLGGVIDEVAVYDSVLSAARILAHYEAGTTAFDGEWSGERIDRVLDIIGLDADLRDIDTGDTVVGAASYGGETVASYLQKVVESEQGYLYVDHRNGGKLTYRSRFHRFTDSRSKTPQATFTDVDAFGKHCYRNDIAPESNGIATVVNTVDVSWRGGTETVVDSASRDVYGAQKRSLTTEAPTPSAAEGAGAWLIARYKDPQSRVRDIPLAPGGRQYATLAPELLDLGVHDRVTVERHPLGIGNAISDALLVEGAHHEMTPEGAWYSSLHTSQADTGDVWIWGTSTWGQTTAWG